mgnify:CR=1 FL=1
MKKKSIIINEFHHKNLVKLSSTFGVQYGGLVENMILYFKKTGINPMDAINENPSVMVKTLDKRIVSFLKVQERDILKPLRQEVYEYSIERKREIEKLSNFVESVIKKIDEVDNIRTKFVASEIKKQNEKQIKIQQAIVELSQLIDSKNKSGIHGKIKNLFD